MVLRKSGRVDSRRFFLKKGRKGIILNRVVPFLRLKGVRLLFLCLKPLCKGYVSLFADIYF